MVDLADFASRCEARSLLGRSPSGRAFAILTFNNYNSREQGEPDGQRPIAAGPLFERLAQGARAGLDLPGNGIKLQGQIDSFDQFVVLLKNSVSQMVYKHAISTVVPARNVRLQPEEGAPAVESAPE